MNLNRHRRPGRLQARSSAPARLAARGGVTSVTATGLAQRQRPRRRHGARTGSKATIVHDLAGRLGCTAEALKAAGPPRSAELAAAADHHLAKPVSPVEWLRLGDRRLG